MPAAASPARRACPHRLTVATGTGARTGQGSGHLVRALLEARKCVGEADRDARETRQPFQRHGIRQGLHEGIAPRPAEHVRSRLDRREQPTLRSDVLDRVIGRRVGQHRVRQADGLKGPQALVVHTDAARVVDQRRKLFHDQRSDGVLAKHVGQQQAGRPGAHDQHVRLVS